MFAQPGIEHLLGAHHHRRDRPDRVVEVQGDGEGRPHPIHVTRGRAATPDEMRGASLMYPPFRGAMRRGSAGTRCMEYGPGFWTAIRPEIGRASGRGRGWSIRSSPGVGVTIKKKKN